MWTAWIAVSDIWSVDPVFTPELVRQTLWHAVPVTNKTRYMLGLLHSQRRGRVASVHSHRLWVARRATHSRCEWTLANFRRRSSTILILWPITITVHNLNISQVENHKSRALKGHKSEEDGTENRSDLWNANQRGPYTAGFPFLWQIVHMISACRWPVDWYIHSSVA